MLIRPATRPDIPAMTALLGDLFTIEADFTPNPRAQSRGLDLLFTREDTVIFVAEIGHKIAGMCTVQTLVSTAMGCTVGIVEGVIVGMEFRKKGIGSSLLETAETWAKEKNLGRLQLLADRDNHQALSFYRHRCWEETNLIGYMKKYR